MARPARPERSRSARSSRQLSRFYHSINLDRVFGTHTHQRLTKTGEQQKTAPPLQNRTAFDFFATDCLLPCTNYSSRSPFRWLSQRNSGAVRYLSSRLDRKSTRLNSSHRCISYAV